MQYICICHIKAYTCLIAIGNGIGLEKPLLGSGVAIAP